MMDTLKKNKMKDLFIYSGGSIMSFIDGFYKNAHFKYYINTNEHNLGMAAVGYSKTTKKIGTCLVTSGPGITNMITPMLDAKNDSTPLVVISGQVPINVQGTNAFQEAPALQLTKHVTKENFKAFWGKTYPGREISPEGNINMPSGVPRKGLSYSICHPGYAGRD